MRKERRFFFSSLPFFVVFSLRAATEKRRDVFLDN